METTNCDIANRHCQPCEGGVPALSRDECEALLERLPGWALGDDLMIEKTFHFKNHYQAMAFVNAVAWISHSENHHPEMVVGYADCKVHYWTHAINGLSENDFICAAKVEKLAAV